MRLIDADALMEGITTWQKDLEKEYGWHDAYVQCLDGVISSIESASTVNPWHRVEERLPNVGELVVGLDADGHPEITMLSEAKCWLTYGLWIHNLGCYVWWMPLPEPPKEGA